jgi:hypothetical protein
MSLSRVREFVMALIWTQDTTKVKRATLWRRRGIKKIMVLVSDDGRYRYASDGRRCYSAHVIRAYGKPSLSSSVAEQVAGIVLKSRERRWSEAVKKKPGRCCCRLMPVIIDVPRLLAVAHQSYISGMRCFESWSGTVGRR